MRAGVRGMHEFIKTLADPHLEKCEQIGVGQVLLVRRQLVEVCQTRHGGGCSLQSNLPPFQQKDFLFCEAVSDGLDAPFSQSCTELKISNRKIIITSLFTCYTCGQNRALCEAARSASGSEKAFDRKRGGVAIVATWQKGDVLIFPRLGPLGRTQRLAPLTRRTPP